MSSSDRNVGSNASHHIPLDEFFEPPRENPRRPGNNPAQGEEGPNERITVRINLNQGIVPPDLVNELENNNNMRIIRPSNYTGIIIISGIPPMNGFDQHQVLQIVTTYVPNAVLA